MKLTTKGRYAVTAMLDLAINHDEVRTVTLSDISQRQGISLSYLEQLFAKLRSQGLVKSTRGPGGGYCLSRPAKKIALDEIITAVDENIDTMLCRSFLNCHDSRAILTQELWADLSKQIIKFLNGISLEHLLNRRSKDVTKIIRKIEKARRQRRKKS
ncbi:MAG: [Fe-S]-binding protein [Gammaproteobacteria bacterium]|nr:MAG: [Fe-S]-binding protein [Gammaproteobacteria bacterium]RKZ40399.1 MAG: [Fe-S]-binding protein [Gammaproteobacteria bacterium]RKZ76835.1 MAG: [Fe-S]-binding protein [Gammaproteobacteria bacterium]